MRSDEQKQLIKQLISRIDSGTNVDAGGLRHNPTAVYTDPELAARENQEFFTDHPQIIGLSGDLPEPGSFITVNDLRVPILATRTNDGTFRAMVNICRHRGVRVETEAKGTARRFTCPFHAWSYDIEGTLVGLPKAEQFGEIDTECHGLQQLPAVEYHGFLIVHQDPNGMIDTDELFTDELAAEFASWKLGDLVAIASDTYAIDCNWKLAMDTFGETYHFETLHRNTLAQAFRGNVQCYDTYGRNHRMILCRRDIDEMRELPEEQWSITAAGLPVYWLFPNVQLIISFEIIQLVRAYPVPDEPGKHVSQITFYVEPQWFEAAIAASGGDRVSMEEIAVAAAHGFGLIIRDEDYMMSASQQASAESGALPHVVFGRNEPALHHYHNTYRAALGLDLLPLLDQ